MNLRSIKLKRHQSMRRRFAMIAQYRRIRDDYMRKMLAPDYVPSRRLVAATRSALAVADRRAAHDRAAIGAQWDAPREQP